MFHFIVTVSSVEVMWTHRPIVVDNLVGMGEEVVVPNDNSLQTTKVLSRRNLYQRKNGKIHPLCSIKEVFYLYWLLTACTHIYNLL
jgi:hypothetical protein